MLDQVKGHLWLYLVLSQALRVFGSALQTGQLGPLVGQFDISEAARSAAVEGGEEMLTVELSKS